MAELQRKFPLSAKLQMEGLPMEILAGDAGLTQCAAKDKMLSWAPISLSHERAETWSCLGERVSWNCMTGFRASSDN